MKRKLIIAFCGVCFFISGILMFLNYLNVGEPLPLVSSLVFFAASIRQWVAFFSKSE